MIDLHLHSTESDGVLAPAAVVALAASNGVQMLALTDHDTTAGLDAAHAAARRHGIAFVAGAEVSANWGGRAIHVLALAIDPQASALAAGLERTRTLRRERARSMADRLKRHGLPGDELFEMASATAQVLTRTHLARALAQRGIVPDAADAYAEWLGQGRPGHVAANFCPLGEVVGWIRAAGGHAVIAHPLRYRLSAGQRRSLIADFKAAGGAGIEVVTGGQSTTQIEAATGIALRAGLAGSVGSDFHDPAIPWNPPGRLANLPPSVTPIWARPGFPPGASGIA
ncbi:MAG TPA: PHP domain-containing protein [Steroidobacteraceae bacterium]|nr:PHP domain-containing protein [Steroidobacteraceae bacterium]